MSEDIYLKKKQKKQNSKNSMWFTMLWLNRCNRIVTCKERIEHHALVQSYLDIFRSWQKNKNYNTQLRINKNAQIFFHSSHARIRDQRDSCHKKKSCHAFRLPWEEAQPLDHTWCKGSGRQRTKRQLCSVILCFEAYCALTARKSSVKPQNSPKVRPDRASSLTRRVQPFKSLCPVKKAEDRDDGKHAKVLITDGRHKCRVNVSFQDSKKGHGRYVSCESTANEWRSLVIAENEGKRRRWQRHFTSGAQQSQRWDNGQLMQATNGTQKKKKTQWVVGTYGAEMCKIDTAHFRGLNRVGRGKRLFTVCCGNTLDRLWCSHSLHSSFNTITKENKKKQLHGI